MIKCSMNAENIFEQRRVMISTQMSTTSSMFSDDAWANSLCWKTEMWLKALGTVKVMVFFVVILSDTVVISFFVNWRSIWYCSVCLFRLYFQDNNINLSWVYRYILNFLVRFEQLFIFWQKRGWKCWFLKMSPYSRRVTSLSVSLRVETS